MPPSPSVPGSAFWLGYAGALPFALGAILLVLRPFGLLPIPLSSALLGYGAVILSFMGGVQWGLAIAAEASPSLRRLAASVTPALAGWAALLIGGKTGFALLVTAFALLFAADYALVRREAAPGWYVRLRLPLTVIVVSCLLVAIGAA